MVEDNWKGMGPLAGIEAGFTASKTERNLIVACDMPFISIELGKYLLIPFRSKSSSCSRDFRTAASPVCSLS